MLNYIQIDLPSSSLDNSRINSFTIKERWYQHDLITVGILDWSIPEADIRSGTPVRIKINNVDEYREFTGYVHNSSRVRKPGYDFTQITFLGSTFVFKQASQKVYTNKTASAVATEIAMKHGFAYDIAPHKRVYPQIAQAGQTDWQLLTRLAKQCGYGLRADNTTLMFKPLNEEYERTIPSAPEFFLGSIGSPAGTTVYEFNSITGETLMYEDAYKSAVSVSGSDPKAAMPFAVTNKNAPKKTRAVSQPELFDRFDTHTVAMDYTTAEFEAKAADELNRFPYRATAILKGTPSIKPGIALKLSSVSNDFDGYWTVLSVDHCMERSVYTTKVVLGTDSLGTNKITSNTAANLYGKNSGKVSRILVTGSANLPIGSADTKLSVSLSSIKPNYSVRVAKVANRATPDPDPTAVSSAVWTSKRSNVRTAPQL